MTMENMTLRPVKATDREAVFALYQSVLDCPGCTWSKEYPAPDILDCDIRAGAIFGLFLGAEPAAVATVQPDEEWNAFSFWDEDIRNPAALERVAVAKRYQGLGLAKALVRQMEARAKAAGYDGARLLVGPRNESAQRLYDALGYVRRGEARLYEREWDCKDKRFV